MYREQLIQEANTYKAQGMDLPLDLWSDLLNEGICPTTLMAEDDYFEHQEYVNGKEN